VADLVVPPWAGEALPGFEIDVTQERVRAYAEAGGDHNPIHIDTAFAASSAFGGTIAHGMLLLAYLSQLLTRRFGAAWLEGGTIDARFRSPALVGTRVIVGGDVKAVDRRETSLVAECALHVTDAQGSALVTARAQVTLRALGAT
jgi:3-hydroxybutyryl-CoA dehydratase